MQSHLIASVKTPNIDFTNKYKLMNKGEGGAIQY